MIVKLGLAATPLALLAPAAADIVTTPAGTIATAAAGLAGAIYIWRRARHAAAVTAEFARRVLAACKHAEQVPELARTVKGLDERLAALTRELGVEHRQGDRRAAA